MVKISKNAILKVNEYMNQELEESLNLRVFIVGGGCQGFEYGFTFDESKNKEDRSFPSDGFNLLIDPLSYQYLKGATIDYTTDLSGSKFVIDNPHAKSTCSCGDSFSI